MSATTTAAVTAANATVMAANAANAARHRAAVEACQVNLSTFDPAGATVDRKRQYAECVQLLYPAPDQPMPAGLENALKAAIVLALFGAALPWAMRFGDDFVEKLAMTVVGALAVPMVVWFFVGLIMGARWVLFG